MNEAKHSSRQHGTSARDSVHHIPDPYWKRALKIWFFWVGFILMHTAITVYVMSDNLSLIPRAPVSQPSLDSSRR